MFSQFLRYTYRIAWVLSYQPWLTRGQHGRVGTPGLRALRTDMLVWPRVCVWPARGPGGMVGLRGERGCRGAGA